MSNVTTLALFAALALGARVRAQDATPHDHAAHDQAAHDTAAPEPAAHDHGAAHAGHETPAAEPAPSHDHAAHDHAAHDAVAPYTPPPIDAATRAAAFPDLGYMRMADMMAVDRRTTLVRLDRLEMQNADAGGDVLGWELNAWTGGNLQKLMIRSEGDKRGGSTERAELELLWDRSVARWWDVVAGVRGEFAPGDTQSWAAIGVQGMTPYRWSLAATAYVADGGRAATRVETHSEVLVTNRLILEPRVELNWFAQSDDARLRGSGLANVDVGLRLRYEIRREIAPYIGLIRARAVGGTADRVRAAGDDADDTRFVAGIRVWF